MLMGPQNLAVHLQLVREQVAAAATAAGRSVDSVTLLAVSKGHPASAVRAAHALGLRDFGESYEQEARPKMAELRDIDLTWHFIGRVQANKTRPIAAEFAWVHAVDRLKTAARLSQQRPYHAPALNVCIQVNVAAEASKGGIGPDELPELAAAIARLPRLALRGLMCMLPDGEPVERQREWFATLRGLLQSLNARGAKLDTLSMGMSGDYAAAVMEGATIVRVGTALFGARPAD